MWLLWIASGGGSWNGCAREEFRTLGVTTHSVREGGEVSDLTANILAVVAEEEVARLGMRVRHALAEVRTKGWAQVTPNVARGIPHAAGDRRRASARTAHDRL